MPMEEEYTDAASRPNEDEQERLPRLFFARRQAKDLAADLARRVSGRQAKEPEEKPVGVTLVQGRYAVTFEPRREKVTLTTKIKAESGRTIRGVRELDVRREGPGGLSSASAQWLS